MTPEITRVFEIDMGHRLMGHEGKCRGIHGHRYRAEITCRAPELDSVGRVLDFSAIKRGIGYFLDLHYDHALMLQDNDPAIAVLLAVDPNTLLCIVPYSPTVENIVKAWFARMSEILADLGCTATKLRVYETPNCWAEVTNADA